MAQDKYASIAHRWAPVNYQYIRIDESNDYYQTKKDLICPVNLDCYSAGSGLNRCWDTKSIRERLANTRIESIN